MTEIRFDVKSSTTCSAIVREESARAAWMFRLGCCLMLCTARYVVWSVEVGRYCTALVAGCSSEEFRVKKISCRNVPIPTYKNSLKYPQKSKVDLRTADRLKAGSEIFLMTAPWFRWKKNFKTLIKGALKLLGREED